MQNRWEEQLARYVSASFAASQIGNWATQAATLLNKGVGALTLFLGAGLVIANKMTVGELVAFNMLASQVNSPVLRLVQVWQDFHQVRLSVERLGDILNTPVETQAASTQASQPRLEGSIEFERVTFRYGINTQPVLRDVSVSIPAGQVVGIVGPSGSGKSTIAKLAQRLYQPEAGRVLVDGVDTAVLDPSWLRRQIGVVLQENVLFNRSVRENIALADPSLSMEKVIAAAKLAGAHDFICKMPQGYDTSIGERGVSLSGGQRQRVAIARALVGDPRILIFDEATSALDYESESIIQSNMRDIVQGRTVLIIAHRLSTVRSADRILTIENGVIVEDGTHETAAMPPCIRSRRWADENAPPDAGAAAEAHPPDQLRLRTISRARVPARGAGGDGDTAEPAWPPNRALAVHGDAGGARLGRDRQGRHCRGRERQDHLPSAHAGGAAVRDRQREGGFGRPRAACAG